MSNNIDIDPTEEMFVDISEAEVEAEGEIYVMRINGLCNSDYKFRLTTNDEYNNILETYMTNFEVTKEDTQIKESNYNLDEYLIYKTSHFLDPDLCSFCLYKITPNYETEYVLK